MQGFFCDQDDAGLLLQSDDAGLPSAPPNRVRHEISARNDAEAEIHVNPGFLFCLGEAIISESSNTGFPFTWEGPLSLNHRILDSPLPGRGHCLCSQAKVGWRQGAWMQAREA